MQIVCPNCATSYEVKASALGEHNLSGAVVNPRAFRELFPELKDEDFPFKDKVTKEAVYLLRENGQIKIPTPPPMHNAGNFTASISEICRWLGDKAEGMGVNVFPGFPVDSLLVDGQAVRGVRTTPSGQSRDTSLLRVVPRMGKRVVAAERPVLQSAADAHTPPTASTCTP